MAAFCHNCGSQFDTKTFMVHCDQCHAKSVSFAFDESDPDNIYQIGFICMYNDGLSWTEFSGMRTVVYSLRKNYSVIPSFCYDVNNGVIMDPINENIITIMHYGD